MANHPAFEQYKQLFSSGQYGAALTTVDGLLREVPNSVALHWHRALCLDKLERYPEALAALDLFLTRQPDYIPAQLKRIEYTEVALDGLAPYLGHPEESGLSRAERKARSEALQRREQLAAEAAQRNQQQLRAILAREPENVPAMFLLVESLQYSTTEEGSLPDPARMDEARTLLDQVIRLAPDDVDYRRTRAQNRREEAVGAMVDDPEAERPGTVKTLTGMTYNRDLLEAAAEDFRLCWEKGGLKRDAMAMASILHLLGRFDEALQTYDQVLATVAPGDPAREWIVEQRRRSENQGAGEREQVAALLLSGLGDSSGKDETQAESQISNALRGVADAIRQGASVSEAVAANMSDDPDTDRAMRIARNILSLIRQPPPGLVAVDPARYPRVQRRHCDRVARAAKALGLTKIADAEAMGLFSSLGRHVLIRLFANGEGDIGLASFAFLPKWPGLGAFLRMYLTGKWTPARMTECVTQFEDGTLISTQPESVSPFEYGGKVIVHKLPADASVATIYQTHAAAVAKFRAANPAVRPMLVHTIEAADARWIAGQESKTAYRRSIGYITERELRRLLGQHYDDLADKVMAQVRRMAGES